MLHDQVRDFRRHLFERHYDSPRRMSLQACFHGLRAVHTFRTHVSWHAEFRAVTCFPGLPALRTRHVRAPLAAKLLSGHRAKDGPWAGIRAKMASLMAARMQLWADDADVLADGRETLNVGIRLRTQLPLWVRDSVSPEHGSSGSPSLYRHVTALKLFSRRGLCLAGGSAWQAAGQPSCGRDCRSLEGTAAHANQGPPPRRALRIPST